MKKTKGVLAVFTFLLCAIIIEVCFLFATDGNIKGADEKKEVLFISSYSYAWETVPRQIDGIESVLADSVNISYEFMDTKNIGEEEAYEILKAKLETLKEKGIQFDAVITGDDTALKFAVKYQLNYFKNTPVIFEGTDDLDLAQAASKNKWITGVIEKPSYIDNFRLIQSLFPETRKIAAIVDNTVTGTGVEKQFLSSIEEFEVSHNTIFEYEVINSSEYTKDEMKNKLASYSGDTAIFYLSMNTDANGSIYSKKEIQNMMENFCSVPVFRMAYSGIGNGVLGGKIVSHYESGVIAANMVMDIFSGIPVESIGMVTESPCEYCFDYNTMKKFHVSKVMLPENSVILNKNESFLEKYANIIIVAAVVVIIFIAVLFYTAHNNVRYAKKLKESQRSNKESLEKNKKLSHDIVVFKEIANFTISREFRDIFLVNLNTGQYTTYFAEGVFENGNAEYSNAFRVFLDSIHEGDKRRCMELASTKLIKEVLDKNDGKYILELRNLIGGEYVWLEYSLCYFNETRDMVLILSRNINNVMLREKEVEKRFELALDKANQSAEAKKNFLSHMSHEMRTPLNGIKGMLELMSEQEPFRDSEYLKKTLIATNHLTELVNDVLDMSKIESGKVEIRKEITKWGNIENEIDAVIKPLVKSKQLNFEYIHNKNYFEYIYCDSKRIKQTMINILSNSVKYTEPGGSIKCSVSERLVGDGSFVELDFEVRDTGIGMSREFLKKVFTPFEQADSNKENSTGLGLAITKELVELMGGRIYIDSRENEGTKVNIILMLEGVDVETVKLLESEQMKHDNISGFKDLTALLVEDDEINMEITDTLVRKLGVKIIKAVNGQQAVDIFEETPDGEIDIILMDIMMPVLNGLKAAEKIRSSTKPEGRTIPIIAMTANAFEEDIKKSMDAGMNYHLTKPFKKGELVEILAAQFPDKIVKM